VVVIRSAEQIFVAVRLRLAAEKTLKSYNGGGGGGEILFPVPVPMTVGCRAYV